MCVCGCVYKLRSRECTRRHTHTHTPTQTSAHERHLVFGFDAGSGGYASMRTQTKRTYGPANPIYYQCKYIDEIIQFIITFPFRSLRCHHMPSYGTVRIQLSVKTENIFEPVGEPGRDVIDMLYEMYVRAFIIGHVYFVWCCSWENYSGFLTRFQTDIKHFISDQMKCFATLCNYDVVAWNYLPQNWCSIPSKRCVSVCQVTEDNWIISCKYYRCIANVESQKDEINIA